MHRLSGFDPHRSGHGQDITDGIISILRSRNIVTSDRRHIICVFNPSIAGGYTSARVIGLKPEATIDPQFTFKNPFQKNIPWSEMVDGTVILHGNSFLNFFPGKVDMRLMQFGSKIMVIFNEYVSTTNPIKPMYRFRNFPGAKTRVYIELSSLDGDQIAEPIEHPCADRAAAVEKNWSMWIARDNTLRISYSLSPHHVFFKPDATSVEKCSVMEDDTVFQFPEHVHISLGTHAVRYDYKNAMLAVGHAKINTKDIKEGEYSFPIENRATHPNASRNYKYFMFFYKFDSSTGKILDYSGFFIPSDGMPHRIFFPTGLDAGPYEFSLAYGVDDSKSNILTLNREVIESLFNKELSTTIHTIPIHHAPI